MSSSRTAEARWSSDASAARQRFDVALQRAVATGLGVALLMSVAAAALGAALYPVWWWLGVAPVAGAAVAWAVGRCATGRFAARDQIGFGILLSVAALATALAAGEAARPVGTAILPVVVLAELGTGFVATPVRALLVGGTIIVGDTLLPLVARPDAAAASLVETGVQTLIVVAAVLGGWAARRVAAGEVTALRTLAEAAAAERAERAARAERRELQRQIHDIVLNTLSALSRGGLPDSPQVRAECADASRFLRTRDAVDGIGRASLRAQLDVVVETVRRSDFAVEVVDLSPVADLPPDAATAMARATRAALLNARTHSGAPGARVEVRAAEAGVAIRVVDRGCGTAPGSAPRLGMTRSLVERMQDAGGSAEFHSVPGDGTIVTLRWPAPP